MRKFNLLGTAFFCYMNYKFKVIYLPFILLFGIMSAISIQHIEQNKVKTDPTYAIEYHTDKIKSRVKDVCSDLEKVDKAAFDKYCSK